jgi:hypothetical protein
LNNPMDNCSYKEWKEAKIIMEDEYPYLSPDEIAKAIDATDPKDMINKMKYMDILEVLVKIYDQGVDSFMASKSKLSWSKLADGSYFIQSSGIGKIAIRVNAMGEWELWRKEIRKAWNKLFTGEAAKCFEQGDGIIDRAQKTNLYLRSASWKHKPAKRTQLDFIRKLTGRAPCVTIDSRGKASHLINYLLESKRR